jgi:hypothetical protein
MNLNAKINLEFDRLAAQPSNPSDIRRLTVDTKVGTLTSDLTALDGIACAFQQFTFKTDKLAGVSLDDLKQVSDSLSKRLTYLLEPISPIETDSEGCTLQLRSSPPQKDDDGTSYYELLVRRGGELSLCRYTQAAGTGRRVIPANVTREVFHRLASDFISALS